MLVRRPPADCSDWERYRWLSAPDPAALSVEHESLCAALEVAGAAVVIAEPTTLDAVYVYDAALISDEGAVLLRPGKAERADEPSALGPDLERAGVKIAGRLGEPTVAEGGDFFWLDDRTLCGGCGYRTNSEGLRALERMLGVELLVFDLPRTTARRPVSISSRYSARWPTTSSSPIPRSCPSDSRSCWPSAASESSRCPTRSSRRSAATRSRSPHGSP